jgi:hypothetical protein
MAHRPDDVGSKLFWNFDPLSIRLHSATSQKTDIFRIVAVKTFNHADPTEFTKYQDDRIKDEMGGTCSMHCREEKCAQNFCRENWSKYTTLRPRRWWQKSTKTDIEEVWHERVHWILLTRYTDQWWALVNTVTVKGGNFFIEWVTIKFLQKDSAPLSLSSHSTSDRIINFSYIGALI